MHRALACAALLAACGDPPDPGPQDLVGKLEAIPGVTLELKETDLAGYVYYVLRFTQPVDHTDPGGQTFQQKVSLIHRDETAPMTVLTSGYFDYYNDSPVELTNLLQSNQISIEHRFFGESRPDPADWTKLTIEQMANDQHVIIAALRDIYPAAFVSTGGSKGGMTATYHRRFFPDDVDATVPYVAPMSTGAPDTRYTAFVDTIGPAACRSAIRAVAIEMLENRRDAMEDRARAQPGHSYSRIALEPAVEGSIAALEWAFWQYHGVGACDSVPLPTASDAALFSFLDRIAPVGDNDDQQVAAFEAYYYQAYAQLGFPDGNATYLDSFLMFTDRDYDRALPTALPVYDDGAAMRDVASFVQNEGDRLLFIYGEWDPWTGGAYQLGDASDSLKLVQPQGTHGARITELTSADRAAAFAKLAAWTGVTPSAASSRRARTIEPLEPRIPPALVRLRTRR